VRGTSPNKSGVGVGSGVFVAVGVAEGIGVIVEDGVGEGGRVGERVACIPTDGERLDIDTACSTAALLQLEIIIGSSKQNLTLVIRIFISFLAYPQLVSIFPRYVRYAGTNLAITPECSPLCNEKSIGIRPSQYYLFYSTIVLY